jgi:hypothetical protein
MGEIELRLAALELLLMEVLVELTPKQHAGIAIRPA